MNLSHANLVDLERRSIRGFLTANAQHLTGDVLDFGCGKQPYRDIVEQAGGNYVGFDRREFPANVSQADIPDEETFEFRGESYDATICTQVIQYVDPREIEDWLVSLYWSLRLGGVLLMTGPTSWPLVEHEDLARYTPAGIYALLSGYRWRQVHVARRAEVTIGITFTIGWQAIAWR